MNMIRVLSLTQCWYGTRSYDNTIRSIVSFDVISDVIARYLADVIVRAKHSKPVVGLSYGNL